eukprot:2921445-Pyramimonas_sp.AAC.1
MNPPPPFAGVRGAVAPAPVGRVCASPPTSLHPPKGALPAAARRHLRSRGAQLSRKAAARATAGAAAAKPAGGLISESQVSFLHKPRRTPGRCEDSGKARGNPRHGRVQPAWGSCVGARGGRPGGERLARESFSSQKG